MTQLETDLQQPVALRYLTSTVTLEPSAIDFTFDITETKRLAQDARTRSSSLSDFLRHLILQPPADARHSRGGQLLRRESARLPGRGGHALDVPPRPPAPQIDQLTLTPGQPGRLLNIVDSMPPLEDALKSAQKRTADLVVEDQAAPPPTLEQLKQLLQARLAAFQGTASVFVKDLQTGEELHLNPDVPFSGGGVMKLPIVAEIYRKYDLPLDITTTQRLTAALTTELSNLPANQLLNQIGEGNTFAGANTTTASLAQSRPAQFLSGAAVRSTDHRDGGHQHTGQHHGGDQHQCQPGHANDGQRYGPVVGDDRSVQPRRRGAAGGLSQSIQPDRMPPA